MLRFSVVPGLLGVLVAGQARAGVFPYPITTRTLDNGLVVHVVPMPSPGVVAFATWMSVGSRDEVDAGRTGFAHFFEHLMFLGTPTLSGAQRDRALLRMGADDNAWTWVDETVYHVVAPASNLESLIRMEGDRFQHLTLTPEQVRRESGAVYGEYRKDKSDPAEQLGEALHVTAFTSHTYRHSTIGFEPDIAAMPEAHAYAQTFFDRHYRPENAEIYAVGDVKPDEVFGWVAASWGAWSPSPIPPPPPPVEPPQKETRRVDLPWPHAIPPMIDMGWKIPAARPDDPEVAALSLVEGLLLSDVGTLRGRLIDELGLAYDVAGGREDFVDPGLFVVHVELAEGADPGRVEQVILEEISRLSLVGDAAALDRIRAHTRQTFLSSLDDPLDVAMALGWATRRGGTPDAIDRYYERFDKVTLPDVQAVVAKYLVPSGLTVATLRPGAL